MPARSEVRPAFFASDRSKEFLQLKHRSDRLFGSDIYVVRSTGELWYVTYRDLAKDAILRKPLTRISRQYPAEDLSAPYSRKKTSVIILNRIHGGVEKAIRNMDGILEHERNRETQQVQALTTRAHELWDLFSDDFQAVTPQQQKEATDRTYRMLVHVHLDPERIINEEKKRITRWVIKASTGLDSRDRPNKLITLMALSAAYRHRMEKQLRIGKIIGKFVRMREALIFEREVARAILAQVAEKLKPRALPSDTLFRHPERPADRHVGTVLGMLNTITFQLNLPHAAPYAPVAREAATRIAAIYTLLKKDNRTEIVNQELFERAFTSITEVLETHKDVYATNHSQ